MALLKYHQDLVAKTGFLKLMTVLLIFVAAFMDFQIIELFFEYIHVLVQIYIRVSEKNNCFFAGL